MTGTDHYGPVAGESRLGLRFAILAATAVTAPGAIVVNGDLGLFPVALSQAFRRQP